MCNLKLEVNQCYNLDCKVGMQLMKEQGIKADWCITDPPYGIGVGTMTYTNGVAIAGKAAATRRDYTWEDNLWDNERIGKEFFDLIFELSGNQILFGGNYYTDVLPVTKSWVVWDKRCDDKLRNSFSDCELAWCSQGVARVFHYMFNGMLQGDMANKDYRFHPTQKPTQLWTMLLNHYTKEGDLILDPFAGSQSLRIACHKLKRRYIGFEISKGYFKKGTKWFEQETAQVSIFDLLN